MTWTWLLILCHSMPRNHFPSETFKVTEENSSHYVIGLWYMMLAFIWYTFPGVVCGASMHVLKPLMVWWNGLMRLCESEIISNSFWGRETFSAVLLLRRRSQSGFREPSRKMCAAPMYDFLLSTLHVKKTVRSDRSYGIVNRSDENYDSVGRCKVNNVLTVRPKVLKCRK